MTLEISSKYFTLQYMHMFFHFSITNTA